MNNNLEHSRAYDPQIAGSIDTKRLAQWKYSPVFSAAAPKLGAVDLYATCNIVLSGVRRTDFAQCLIQAHLPAKPVGYTWHHVYNPNLNLAIGNNFSHMELVRTSLHRKTCPHVGSCKQYSEQIGAPYKLTNIGEILNAPQNEFGELPCKETIFKNMDNTLMSGLKDGTIEPGVLYLVTINGVERVIEFFAFDNSPESYKNCWDMSEDSVEIQLYKNGYYVCGSDSMGNYYVYDLRNRYICGLIDFESEGPLWGYAFEQFSKENTQYKIIDDYLLWGLANEFHYYEYMEEE